MTESTTETYRVYCIRWFQLTIYALEAFVNSLFPATFVAIELQTASFFSISSMQVNLLTIVVLFLYVPGTILSSWAFQRYSMRTVVIVGSLMNLGAWIRMFALISPSNGYAWLILGQVLPGLSAPIFFNSVALFAARWFAPGQRDLATAIGTIANTLGSAAGVLYPSLIVTDPPSSQQFAAVLASEPALATLIAVLVLVVFRSSPPTPPSPSDEQQPREFKKDIVSLLTNPHYIILLITFSIGFGIFNALGSVLSEITQPCGYSSGDAGVFGAVLIVTGLVSAGIAGFIMDRTHAYKLLLKILIIGSCGSFIYFIVILRPSMFYPLTVAFGLMGFFLLPLLPVVFECTVECTYPIRAVWSIGLLLCVGSVLGGVFIFVLDELIKKAPTYTPGVVFTPAAIFLFCMVVFATIVLLFYNGPYLRWEAEKVQKTEQLSQAL